MNYWTTAWIFLLIHFSCVHSNYDKKFAVKRRFAEFKPSTNITTKLTKLAINNENGKQISVPNSTFLEGNVNYTQFDNFSKIDRNPVDNIANFSYSTTEATSLNNIDYNNEIIINITSTATESTAHNVTSRFSHGRDLMVVLPVMQGNSDISNSNLQILYTKAPVTTFVGEHSNDEIKSQLTRTTIQGLDRRGDFSENPIIRREETKRHPYTEFLVTKPLPSKLMSPLDYGYPESFKFVQELNELPKNHKPEWAVSEAIDTLSTNKVTTEEITRKDPFQMFESVKPLEINKLLSVKQNQAPATDSVTEETITKKISSSYPSRLASKIPYVKRPMKKPQKTKLSAVVTKSALLSSTPPPFVLHTSAASPFDSEDLLTAARYTTLLSQSTKSFLPTPYVNSKHDAQQHLSQQMDNIQSLAPINGNVQTNENVQSYISLNDNVEPLISLDPAPVYVPNEPLSVTFVPVTVSTSKIKPTTSYINLSNTNAITVSPTTVNPTTVIPTTFTTSASSIISTTTANTVITSASTNSATSNVTECSTENKSGNSIKAADIINLSKILSGNLSVSTNQLWTKEPPVVDDISPVDLRNMLLTLGLLNPYSAPISPVVVTTTAKPTTKWADILLRKQPITPSIDPNSYQTFKKIPFDDIPESNLPLNDDMKDLLASFGLIPKKSTSNSIRISRHYNVSDDTKDFFVNIDDNISEQFNTQKANFSSEINSTSDLEENFVINLIKNNDSFSMFPDDVKNTLENLGFLKPLPYIYQPHKSGHVFQPTSHLEKLSDEQKVQKINDVIKSIKKLSTNNDTDNLSKEEIEKKLQNITTSIFKEEDPLSDIEVYENATDINDILNTTFVPDELLNFATMNESSTSSTTTANSSSNNNELNLSMSPPNPLSPEELQLLYETNKNEIKRQQPTEMAVDLLPTTVPTLNNTSTESNTSTRVESNNAPISDLAESFGGGETASEEPTADDFPTPKPNGLYFYVDWNTFLNVGEADKNPVNIRFAPRAGNPRNFLPITVP